MAPSLSRWSRAAVNGAYRARSLRIMVAPAPITFAERRAVLQVLQKQGAVDVFTMVPDYPAQFIAVTKHEDAAESLIAANPLTYTVTGPQKSPDIKYVDLSRPDILDGTKATVHPGNTTPGVDERGQEHKKFKLRILPLDNYNHAGTMDSSPLNRSWPASYTRHETFMSSILKQSLPHNMAAKGLARWDYDLDERGEPSRKRERLQLWRWMPLNMRKLSEKDEQRD